MTDEETEELRKNYPPFRKGSEDIGGLIFEDTVWGALTRREIARCFRRIENRSIPAPAAIHPDKTKT